MKFMLASVALGLGLTAGCGHTHSNIADADRAGVAIDDDGDEQDQQVAIADLPAAVRAAVLSAVSGMVLESAELETEDGVQIYSVEGTANGTKYCIEVSVDGKVLKTETDEDGDEDDDGDEDEDG